MIASYRSKRKRRVVGAVLACSAGLAAQTDPGSVGEAVELPDGSEVTIAKVTSGADQRFVYGSSWEKFTYSVVPGSLLDKEQGDDEELSYRRFRDHQGRKAIFRPKEHSVVLWVRHKGLDDLPSSYDYERQFQVVTVGPDGRPFSTAVIHPVDKIKDRSILAWELERFPRREATIDFSVRTERSSGWVEIARFSVPNPVHKEYPEWQPKPLPIRKEQHGLTVKLTDVKTGDHPSYYSPGRDPTPYETRIGVEVHVDGEPTTTWQPVSFSWSDATGNQHPNDWDGILHDNVNNEQGRIFQGLIGTSEPWKIRVGFRAKPGASLPEESLVHISDFRLSTNETSVVKRKVRSVVLALRTKPKYDAPLRLQRTPFNEKDQVTIVSAKTESGEKVSLSRQVYNRSDGTTWYGPEDGEIAMPKRLDLTLAVYKTREFEFVAQPEWFSERWTSPTEGDIPELIAGLKSSNGTTRWNAAEALERLGSRAEPAVPALTKALTDSSSKVRRTAANALGNIGPPAKQASDELIGLLDDPNKFLPGTAARALKDIGAYPGRVVPKLEDALDSEDSHLRRSAATALGEYAPQSPAIVGKLLDLLDDAGTWVREAAVESLGSIHADPERVVPELIPMLEDDYDGIRREAFEAIVTLGVPSEESLKQIVEIGQVSSDSEIREAAIKTLGRLGDQARPLVPDLEAIAKGAEPTLAPAAAASLLQIDPSNQVAYATFVELMDHSKARVRSNALGRLGNVLRRGGNFDIENEALREAVVNATEDSDEGVRAVAIRKMAKLDISSKEAVESLVDALNDESERVRRYAARALAVLGADGAPAKRALPKLKEMMENAGYEDRYEFALAIWRLDPSREAFKTVADILRKQKGGGNIHMLEQIGPPAEPFVPILEELKEETGDQHDREQISEALAKIQQGRGQTRKR